MPLNLPEVIGCRESGATRPLARARPGKWAVALLASKAAERQYLHGAAGAQKRQNQIFLSFCPPPRLETEPTRTQERWDCPPPPLALTAQDSVPRLRRHIAGDTAQGGGATPFFLSSRGKFSVMCCGYGPPVERYRSASSPLLRPLTPRRSSGLRFETGRLTLHFFPHLSGLNFALDASYGFRTRVFSGRRPVRWSFFVTGVLLLRWRPRKTQHLERWARPLRRRAAC